MKKIDLTVTHVNDIPVTQYTQAVELDNFTYTANGNGSDVLYSFVNKVVPKKFRVTQSPSEIDALVVTAEADKTEGYLVYVAKVSQSGVGNPVIVVKQNTLGLVPAWQKDAAGLYAVPVVGILADAIVTVTPTRPDVGRVGIENDGLQINLVTTTPGGVVADGIIQNGVMVEFRVY